MATRRLIDLPIRHIEHVFSPAGLPLPAKGDTEGGTTSILVRGGAGTGKTTLALGLAYAIAKAGDGLVLYLTTEFSPVEIAFKATLIGLEEKIVDVWPGSEGIQSGGVIVESLSYLRQGNPVTSSAERKSSVIDEVWKLLHPEKPSEAKPSLPIRSVVIDALTLPDPGENEGTLRADVVAFVQALENEGISVVLVEELGLGASAWSSFVVDVVFELSFQPDSETHDLRRKLTVLKSRYALSIPGPHDYGLESGVPAVWPDLFRVLTIDETLGNKFTYHAATSRIMIPVGPEQKWVAMRAGIILSPYDKTGGSALKALRQTPGTRFVDIRCGAQTRISSGNLLRIVNEDDGIYAIGWAILEVSRATGANTCKIEQLDGALSRPTMIGRTLRLLEGLRVAGFLICVHAPSTGMTPFYAVANYDWGGKKQIAVKVIPRRYRTIVSQLCEVKPIPTENDDAWTQTMLPATEPNPWNHYEDGDDWLAADAALAAVESENPDPSMLLLWKCICAAIAKNHAAIDELKSLIGKPDELRILDALLRGLVGTKQLEEADRIIADVAARHNLAPWMAERLRADARIDADDKPVLDDAIKRLTNLLNDEALPAIEKPETKFNLAMALERAGSTNESMDTLEQIIADHPEFEPAPKELERLRNPPKPS